MTAQPLGYAFAHALCRELDDAVGPLSCNLANGIGMPDTCGPRIKKEIAKIRGLLDRIEFHTGLD